jgi:Golgi phosphoprotein 3
MLTIAEDFILMALDPKTGDFRRLQTEYLHAGLIGASVMELALWERTDSDTDRVWLLDTKPTGYPSLDLILSAMAKPDFPQEMDKVIGALMPLGERVEMDVLSKLRARNILEKTEARSLLLRKVTRHTIRDPAPLQQTKKHLAKVLAGDEIPDPRDVCLLTLAKTCALLDDIVSPADSQAAFDRLSNYSAMDLVGQNVRRYLYLFERDAAG